MIDYSSPRKELELELYTLGIEVKGTSCRCPDPYHEDKNASAGVFEDNGHWRVYCHKCKKGWDLADLQGRTNGKIAPTEPPKTKAEINKWLSSIGHTHKVFTYTSVSGAPILHECRFIPHNGKPKDYRPFYPVDRGYRIGRPFIPYTLYNLPEVVKAPIVVVCEGPKSADAVNAIGLVATTGPFGAGKAKGTDFSPLKGKKVILWPDNDEAGLSHMRDVKGALSDLNCSVAVLEVSNMPLEGDAANIEPDDVLKMIDTAVFSSSVDRYFERNERIMAGELAPPPTPWPFFTKIHQAFNPDTVTLLYGAGGTRKTFFLIHLMRHLMDNGKNPKLLGLEMNESDYIDRILAQKLHLPGFVNLEWKGENPDIVRQSQNENRAYISKFLENLTLPGKALMTCSDVVEWAESSTDADMLIIDPVSYLDVKEVWTEHKELVHRLKRLSGERQIPIIISNHTTKDGSTMAGGDSLNKHTDATYRFHANKDPKELVTCTGLSVARQQYTIHNIIEIEKGRYSSNPYCSCGFECMSNLEFVEHGIVCE